MGKPTGFMEYDRRDVPHRPVDQRVADYFEVDVPLGHQEMLLQAARCMDCGIPFCMGAGCPVANRIPEFNDLVYRNRWAEALAILHSTNNFPEITGRICPAPCEAACTLNINDDAVLIKHIELQIAQRGWDEGWIVPEPAEVQTGQRVAVIGSGPAGLAAAQQLARMGHAVVVFDKAAKPGGLLRYGIPDFKLDKTVLDRRIEQMQAEGVEFQTDVAIGQDISARYLRKRFDTILLAMGAGQPRDLPVQGRGLENVHFAMDFLAQQNKRNSAEPFDGPDILARDKIVVVVGGGDTGSDCVGTSRRQGAGEIHQFEILPEPPRDPPADTPWPMWPRIMRTSSSHEEGCLRRWCVLTKKLVGIGTRVAELHGCEVEWRKNTAGEFKMKELPGTEFIQKVDLVLLAMGFVHVEHGGLVEDLGCELDTRGNLKVDNFATSVEGVFSAGDAATGASLVVRAIAAGRDAADAVDSYLGSR